MIMSCSRSLQSMFIVYILLRSVVTSHSTVTLHSAHFVFPFKPLGTVLFSCSYQNIHDCL